MSLPCVVAQYYGAEISHFYTEFALILIYNVVSDCEKCGQNSGQLHELMNHPSGLSYDHANRSA